MIATFLKREGFYVAVAVLAVALYSPEFYKALGTEGSADPEPRTVQPTDKRLLLASYDDKLKQLSSTPAPRGQYPLAVEGASRILLVIGAGTILALMFRALMKGRLLPPGPHMRSVLTLWDCFKLVTCWFTGTLLLRMIFPSNPALPMGHAGEWAADIFSRILLVGLLIHVTCFERAGRLSDLGLGRRRILHAALVGVIAFVALQPFFWLMQKAELTLLQAVDVKWLLGDAETAMLKTDAPWVLILGVFVAVVAAPVSEELLFRGALQPTLKKWFGPWPGILTTAVFFTMLHRQDIWTMPLLFALGVVLGYTYDRTGSIVAPVVLHVAHNGFAVLQFFAFRSLNLG